MSYIECPNCGQKALAVATRCPGCGRALETGHAPLPASSSGARRLPLIVVLAAVVLGLVVVNAIRGGFKLPPPSTAAVDGFDTPPARPVAQKQAGPADTAAAPRARDPLSPAPAATVAVMSQPKEPPPAPVASSTPPVTPPAAVTEARFANTWVNVHTDPSGRAPVLQILRPGDKVMVKTLEQGWYHVVPDTGSSGYVDAHYLEAAPPASLP